jgi:hypothetical protein
MENTVTPLHVADHAHTVAMEAMLREVERQKAEIFKYGNTPGHNPERLKASWAQWHIINNYYNATIDLLNNEINKASYLIATANETNKTLKIRLEAIGVRPAYTAEVKRDIYNHGTEYARQRHNGKIAAELDL